MLQLLQTRLGATGEEQTKHRAWRESTFTVFESETIDSLGTMQKALYLMWQNPSKIFVSKTVFSTPSYILKVHCTPVFLGDFQECVELLILCGLLIPWKLIAM